MIRIGRTALTMAAFVSAAMINGPAAAAGDGIKIGVLTDMTGPYSMIAGQSAVTAAKMAVDEVGGKVLGMPVTIVAGDHKDDPEVASGVARQWFDQDGVDVITELTSTPVALAVQQIAKERGKIDIVTGAAAPQLTGEACSATGFHWVYDTFALGKGIGRAVADQGDKSWFFITTDAAFGPILEKEATGFIEAAGGKVLGSAHHPPGVTDFSPYLLKAQQSGAQVVAIADAGQDAVGLIRQATEFGIGRGGQRVAGLLMTNTDVHELGLDVAQGMVIVTAFYWDQNPASRAWSKKFMAATGSMPNMLQAGLYSAVLHYLKAIQAAGTADPVAVARKMRELPVSDPFVKNGVVRPDGLMQHDMYLAMVKSPGESKAPWDDLTILETIPGEKAFLPLEKSSCPLAKS
jgi:branched-chain amino acid transport system substrate-binding protein